MIGLHRLPAISTKEPRCSGLSPCSLPIGQREKSKAGELSDLRLD
jgi:hypothetical protein